MSFRVFGKTAIKKDTSPTFVNLIYTANMIFQVTFSVYRMIKLSEAELASAVLSYTVKLFQANA